jgi:hypothetical protein
MVAAAAVRAGGRGADRPAGPAAHRGERRSGTCRGPRRADVRRRDRSRLDRSGAGDVVRAQHGRGLRGQQLADPAADARCAERSRAGQRPVADRVHHGEPARRAPDGGSLVHGGRRLGVRGAGGRRRARRGASVARRPAAARTRATPRRPSAARHCRGLQVGSSPCGRPDPGAHDLHVQHHLRSRMVGARPVRNAEAGSWRGGLRARDHRQRCGGPGRDRVLWLDHGPGEPGEHHACRPGDRDAHTPGTRSDDEPMGGHAGVLRLRRPRLHLGDDIGHRSSAGCADGATGARGQRQPWVCSEAW